MSDEKIQVVIKKKHLVIALIVLLFLIIGSLLLVFNWKNWFGGYQIETSMLDIDPNAVDWNGQPSDDKNSGEQTGIKISGYPSISIPANTETARVTLLNPEGNPCYFTFELVLQDTDESLYKSKLVPPGQAITQITMSRALDAGEYNAILKVTTTSITDGSAMNGANMKTVLIVK